MSRLSFINKIFGIIVAILAAQALAVLAWSAVKGRPSKPEESASEPPASEETSSADEIQVDPVEEDAVNVLICGLDDSAGLTDVIMVASFDVKSGKLNILQIPRDTYIGDGYKTGKINQVYFMHRQEDEPARALANVIEQQMALPINHYLVVTLSGFRDLIDAMGGVSVDIQQRIEFLPDKVIEPGKQHLNGERAEWFVRYRAGYKDGDIGRVNAQKIMIDALFQALHDKGRSEMLRLSMQNFSKVETDMTLTKALSFASEAFQLEKTNINVFTLEGYGKMHNGFAVYEADRQKLIDLLNLHFRPYGEKVNWLGIPSVPQTQPSSSASSAPEEEPALPEQKPAQSEPPVEQEPPQIESEAENSNSFSASDDTGDFPID